MSNYWKNNSFQAQQETSRQSVPNVTLEETNRERHIFRTCFSTAGISETLFQLFVQGRQLVLHLPDFVLREGLLPTRIYEYLVTSFACQFSKWSTFFSCINGDNRSRIRLVCIAMRSDPPPFGECMRRSGRRLYPLSPPRGRGRGASGGIFCKQIDLWF